MRAVAVLASTIECQWRDKGNSRSVSPCPHGYKPRSIPEEMADPPGSVPADRSNADPMPTQDYVVLIGARD